MDSNGKGGVLALREISGRTSESESVVYEAILKGRTFGYLYDSPNDYSLAFTGPSVVFDTAWPYGLIEYEFSGLPPSRIKAKSLMLPPLPPARSFMLRYPHAFACKLAKATVLFEGEESYTDYDLLVESQRQSYSDEVLHTTTKIAFARYDYSVEKNDTLFDCCVTFEVVRETRKSELAFKLPKNRNLSPQALIWIIRHHEHGDTMHQIDVSKSLTVLAETLGQRPASVFSGELS